MNKPKIPRKSKAGPYTQEDAKGIILTWLAAGWSVYRAATEAGISRQTAYDWRAADEDFAQAWAAAVESGVDLLEDTAKARALEKSDRLMEILLKAKRPKEYRDRLAVTHEAPARIELDFTVYERRDGELVEAEEEE